MTFADMHQAELEAEAQAIEEAEGDEACDWCGGPVTDDNPGQPCSGRDGPIHAECHAESGCTRNE